MDSRSFPRHLPSTSGTQSIYEAIKLHDQHPASAAGADDDGLDDAQIDEDNLEARFQDQDLDALLADAGKSTPGSDAASNRGDATPLKVSREERSAADESDPPTWTEGRQSLASRAVTGDEGVPDSILMEEGAVESPSGRRKEETRASVRRPTTEEASEHQTPSRRARERFPNYADDVPASLLLSRNESMSPKALRKLPPKPSDTLPAPVPGPPTNRPRVRWDARQEQAQNYTYREPLGRSNVLHTSAGPIITDPADRAMWMWANVENLDNFLADVYEYFRGKGIWSVMLSRMFEQLTLAFVVSLTVFLTSCVDYRKLPGSKHMSDITIPRCTSKMSGFSNLFLWLLSFFWLFKTFRVLMSVKRLWSMHEFFSYALHVSENELQTITWQTIVSRLMNLRDANARTALDLNARNRRFIGEHSKQRMDAHDIANRLMRRDNYLIALFNKDVLNLTLPVPILNNRQLFSRNLEWSINLCVLDYVFNETGQISQLFLRESHRHELIDGLRRRFLIMGFINIISAPFLVTYFLTVYFLRYFTEFQKNPSQIGSRSYTPLAEWKFREFNELYNFFERRLNMSKPFANRYLDQFPKDKISQTARFIAFVAGSLASVLGAASLLDPDIFLGFEITPERTVLFYLGVFGTVWAVARGLVAEEEDSVFDPEYAITNVADYTRYMPSHWQDRLHTEDVRKEFAQLYQMKVLIFLEEMLSIVFTPFVLWFSLPDCSARIVDFFREFTVHVDGLGYVCSFALFEFQKDGVGTNVAGAPGPADRRTGGTDEPRRNRREDLRDGYYASKDNKMLSSYYSFIDSYAHKPTGKAFNRAHDKRIFRPPPSFPSIHEEATPGDQGAAQGTSPPSRKPHPRTKKHLLDDSALAPSLLLDPAHQPSRAHLRPPEDRNGDSLRQSRAGGRSLGSRHKSPLASPPDMYNDEPGMESIALQEDEELGDSWRTMKGAEDAHEDGDGRRDRGRREEEDEPGGDAGVLGLLYEYQKAQTDGRARGSIGV